MQIECEAPTRERLLLDWLNALVREMAARSLIFGRFLVHIEDGRLRAKAWGETLDPERHRPAGRVKAASGGDLRVGRNADGQWFAQCVVEV